MMAPQAVVHAAGPSTSGNPQRILTLEGLEVNGDKVVLNIPGFTATPKIQVLSSPDRVVVDLPGVIKGSGIGRRELAALPSEWVIKARVAQFTGLPSPVTRMVLEVKSGVHVSVGTGPDVMQLQLSQSADQAVQASFVGAAPSDLKPQVIDTEVVAVSAPRVELPAQAVATPVERAEPLVALTTSVPSSPALTTLPVVPSIPQSLPAVALSGLLPGAVSPVTPVLQDSHPAGSSAKGGRTLGEGPQKYSGARMSIDVQGADLVTFLRILADAGKLNLIVDQDVQGTYSFKFVDTPWDQILDVILKHAGLGKEINNGVLRVAKNKRLQDEENERKAFEEAKALAGETQSITRPLSYAKVGEVRPVLEKILTKRGSVILDERTNTLIISDLPKNLSLVDDLLATLDVQIQQVQIEARVVEASDGFTKAFGVKWPTSNSGDAELKVSGKDAPWGSYYGPSWNSGNIGSTTNTTDGRVPNLPHGAVAFTGGAPGVTSIAGAAGEAWVSFISNRLSVNFILQALEKEGKVKIVSSPKLVTQNNKKAKILSGEKIPYPTQQGGAQGGAITVAFAQANLELEVTPQITSEGTIIMDIKITKAEADFSRTVNGTPTILNKEIETQVLIKDGGTAVLGGVYTTNRATGYTGVPFLGRIPILGALFRTKSTNDKSAELLIFLTPRILKN